MVAFLVVISAAAQTFPAKLGDIDGDGIASISDLGSVVNHISGARRLSNELSVFADVNQDGVVSELDADMVVSAILGFTSLPDVPLTRILDTSPSTGSAGVAVTRETVIRLTQPLSSSTLVTVQQLYAEFGGRKLLARVDVAPDRRKLTLFYLENLPGSARIRVTFDGNSFTDFAGRRIDADGDGFAGGVATIEFDTLSLTPSRNTIVCGRVFASQLNTNGAGGTNWSLNTPLRGVTITADGLEEHVRAETDAAGNFRITNAPAGQFFVHIDGRTATNVSAGIRWPDLAYYPFVGKEWESVAGGETNIGEIFLPLVAAATLQPVSPTNDTMVTFPAGVLAEHPELAGVGLRVPANSLFSDNGNRGGRVGIAPVPPDRLPGPLPNGLRFPLVITVQTDGPANFDQPVPVCFPNLPDPDSGKALAPGDKSALWSFNHDTGQFEVVGSMTVSEDGKLICSDPGVGIPAPGWHAVFPAVPVFTAPGVGIGGGGTNGPRPGDECPAGGERNAADPSGKASDPIHLFSGEMVESVEDLRIPGVGFDFVWTRTYRSKISPNTPRVRFEFLGTLGAGVVPPNMVQGVGWDFSYNRCIVQRGRGTEVCDGKGRRDLYRLRPVISDPNPNYAFGGFFRSLHLSPPITADVPTIVQEDGTRWQFRTLSDPRIPGQIVAIEDRNGNRMRFVYDQFGRLERIIDTLQRPITFGYNSLGFIATITDFAGRVVRYEYYDANEPGGSLGDLKSVTTPAVTGTPNGNDFPRGKTTSYTYSKGFADDRLNHNLLTITDGRRNDPNDPTHGDDPYLVNVYSTTTNPNDPNFDRVMYQIWGRFRVDFTYVPQTPSPANNGAYTKTIVNDRAGHVKEYFYDGANRIVLFREYMGLANPSAPTTETANRPAAKLRPDDPDFYETRFQYNGDNQLARFVDPNGNVTEYTYEADIDPLAPATRRGNLREIRRLPGTHLPVGDQPALVEKFEYLPNFNFVTRHVDARGNVMVNQYDSKGNLTNRIHRIASITEQFSYNSSGQLTSHVHPDNGNGVRRVDSMRYYDSGPQRGYLRQTIVDAGGFDLTTTYEHDAVGNVTRKIDPRGNDTLYAVNQRNQVVREISAEVRPGSGIRYTRDFFYDANDNLVRVEIENRDELGALQPHSRLSTTLEYEILNYLTQKVQQVSATNAIVTQYGYDLNRNRAYIRMGEATAGRQRANTISILYDARDLPMQVTRAFGDPARSTVQFDYDGNKNVARRWEGLESEPRLTLTTFDAYNRPVSITNAMGSATLSSYDPNGNLVRRRVFGEPSDRPGAEGNVRLAEVAAEFDRLNRPTHHTAFLFDAVTQLPIGDGAAVTETVYSDNSQVVAVINDNHHGTTNRYDSAHRLQSVIDAKGNQTAYSFDANGNLLQQTETERSDLGRPAEVFVSRFAYDGVNRLVESVDSASNTNRIAHDSRGNPVVQVDARGNVKRAEFDGLNRLTALSRRLTDSGSGNGTSVGVITTRQVWDDSSRLVAQLDDNGHATRYLYDGLDRQIAVVYAENTGRTNYFDVHDNVILSVDASGTAVTNRYDLLNRLTRRDVRAGTGVVPSTTFESFTHDGLSRLVSARNDASLVTRDYDSLSRITSEVQNGIANQCSYDGVGNLLECRYPGGRVVRTAFDALERPKRFNDVSAADTESLIAEYSFVGPSRVQRRDNGNGTRAEFTYDGISGVPNASGDFGVKQVVRSSHMRTANGSILDDRAYAWDAADNKTRQQDVRAGGSQVTENFRYDSVNRLTESIRGPPATPGETNAYTLDGVGNRTRVQGGTNAGIYTLSAAAPAHRPVNQYTETPFDTRTYDKNGNLTSIHTGQFSRAFEYDFQDRLVTISDDATGTTATYAYDALGRRIQKTVTGQNAGTTRYLHHASREIEERDESDTVLATYVYGLDVDEVLTMRRGGQDYYYHDDDLHNVTALSGAAGVVERYAYGDYGTTSITAPDGAARTGSAIGNPWQFNGRRFDAESGLLFFRSRYYEPRAGRFISRDSAGIWHDPANLGNGYAFVGNNPWSYVDPFGYSASKPWWERLGEAIGDGLLAGRDWIGDQQGTIDDALAAIGRGVDKIGDSPFGNILPNLGAELIRGAIDGWDGFSRANDAFWSNPSIGGGISAAWAAGALAYDLAPAKGVVKHAGKEAIEWGSRKLIEPMKRLTGRSGDDIAETVVKRGSPTLTHADLGGKSADELRALASKKGFVPHPTKPDKWMDPVTNKERLRIDPGHVDKRGLPSNDPKAAAPHHHGYEPDGKSKILDPWDNSPHFPTRQ